MANLVTSTQGHLLGVNIERFWFPGNNPQQTFADVVANTATEYTLKRGDGSTVTYIGSGMTYSIVDNARVAVTGGTYTTIRMSNFAGVIAELSGFPAQPLAQIFSDSAITSTLGGTDSLVGGDGNDRLFGAGGADSLFGGKGNDILVASEGFDNMTGGEGDDRFVYRVASQIEANEFINGGAGVDTIVSELTTGRLDLRLADTRLTGIERLEFATVGFVAAPVDMTSEQTTANFEVKGDSNVNILNIHMAQATFNASGWTLTDFNFAEDRVVFHGTSAAESITGTGFADTILGGLGNDGIAGGGGNDIIFGGSFNFEGGYIPNSGADFIDGGAGNDAIWGMDGADTIDGGEGNDAVTGGAGNDTLYGSAGDDFLFGGEFLGGGFGVGSGNDTLDGGEGRDALYGFDGDDMIVTGAGDDYVEGGEGNDGIVGGAGNSFLIGGAGADTITGGAGFDYLYGNSGADLFNFRAGDSYDWVMDFSAAQGDRLRLDPGFGITSFAAFQAAIVTGSNFTQLTVNGGLDQITLFGIGTGHWTASMVEFA